MMNTTTTGAVSRVALEWRSRTTSGFGPRGDRSGIGAWEGLLDGRVIASLVLQIRGHGWNANVMHPTDEFGDRQAAFPNEDRARIWCERTAAALGWRAAQ